MSKLITTFLIKVSKEEKSYPSVVLVDRFARAAKQRCLEAYNTLYLRKAELKKKIKVKVKAKKKKTHFIFASHFGKGTS